jgi:hypothetical protein
MLRPAPYPSKKLARPIHTKDGGTLRTVLDARTYMLGLCRGCGFKRLVPLDPASVEESLALPWGAIARLTSLVIQVLTRYVANNHAPDRARELLFAH